MSGRFIVVEGVNCAGKTSAIHGALALLGSEHFFYSKGFTPNTAWGRFIGEHPHSFTYYLDLAYKTHARITPALDRELIVIQDRYVQSVDSFLPDSARRHNRLFRRLLTPLLLAPGAFVHVTASLPTIVERLFQSPDAYRQGLARDPERVRTREQEYARIKASLACPTYTLDTTQRTRAESAEALADIIRRESHAGK